MRASVHYLFRDKTVAGTWLNGKPAYLDGYPRAVAQGYRAMAQKPDNMSFEDWAGVLSDRSPTFDSWWEAVDSGDAADPQELLDRLQPGSA